MLRRQTHRTLVSAMALISLKTLMTSVPTLAAPSPTPAALRTLRIYQPEDVTTLDWNLSTHAIDTVALQNLHEGLFKIGPKLELVPGIADRYERSADGRTFKFFLRKEVLWSDGVPLKAQHFVDSWKRLLSPLTASPYAYLLFDIVGAQEFQQGKLGDFSQVGMRAVDDQTLEIKLKEALPHWIWITTFRSLYPIRLDLIQRYANAWTKPGKLVGLGAFTLESIDFGKKITLKKNPRYYAAKAGNIELLELVIYGENEVLDKFKQGAIDLSFVVPKLAKTDRGLKTSLRRLRTIRTKRLTFNLHRYPMTDLRMREAVSMLISNVALAKRLGEGYLPAHTLVPPGFLGYRRTKDFYNPTQAKGLLDTLIGTEPSMLSLLVPAFGDLRDENIEISHRIKSQIEDESALKVSLEEVSTASQWSVLSRSQGYSMILHDWQADFPDSENFYTLYSARSKHSFRWNNPEYDAVLDLSRREANAEHRASLFQKADQILIQKQRVTLPLLYTESWVLMSNRIEARELSPFFYGDASALRLK